METTNKVKKFTIPRTKINLSYFELIKFIFRLFSSVPKKKENDIVTTFENKFAREYEMPNGVVFNKARMAFYFLLKNLDLKPGGEVLMSALHIADFVNIIRCAGFKPVIVDIDKDTYAVDYNDLEKKINDNSVLFLVTHLSGFATDMDRIREISEETNVPFLEDCSQAFGSSYKGRKLGTFGKAAIFSLSLLKPVCTLFGGMVLSNNKELLEKLRQEKKELGGIDRVPLIIEAIKNFVVKTATLKLVFGFFVFPLLKLFSAPMDFFSRFQRANKTVELRKELPKGFFVNFSSQQALLGLEQLSSVHEREKKKIQNAKHLYELIDNNIIHKIKLLDSCYHTFWTFPIGAKDISHFKKYLAKNGIDCTSYLLSVLSDEVEFSGLNLSAPQASRIKKETIIIPVYPSLSQAEVEYLASVINSYKS